MIITITRPSYDDDIINKILKGNNERELEKEAQIMQMRQS